MLPSTYMNAKNGILKKRAESDIATEMCRKLRVKTPSYEKIVNQLSGGNQQKVIIAKWLMMYPKVLILDEPTRGIDVGAKSEIYQIMNELTEQGVSIIMISSDMEEIMGMADRILVMCEGKISGELRKGEYTQEKILEYAAEVKK
mgnify:FL=1